MGARPRAAARPLGDGARGILRRGVRPATPVGRLALALALLGLAASARAGDPRLRWRTLETEHFAIHYHENERRVAERVALVAERAHRVLSPRLKWQPRVRTHLVLTDDSDSANGSATVLPYNLLRLFVTAPDSTSVLNDHDDWLYGLILHEYSHILHLDNVGGLAKLVNAILGKQWAPNQIQPRFVIEGLATYEESKRTSAGRVRSAIFDMYLRTALLEGKLQRLDQITMGGPLQWPQGTTAYVYGASLMAYLADRHGDDAIARLSKEYGGGNFGNWVPFGLNRALRRAIGKDWVTIYGEWREHLRERYELQKVEAEGRGLTSFHRVTTGAYGHDYPVFTPDGRQLLWVQDDGTDRARWMAATVAGPDPARAQRGRPQRVRYLRGVGKVALHPEGTLAAYDEFGPFETVYGYSDLFEYDLARGDFRRLTRGARAREPAYAPDGSRLAFAQGDLGESWLSVMPARGGPIEVLYRGPRVSQVYAPAWSPDGRTIACSVWEQGGYRDLVLIDVGTRAVTRVTRDRALDVDPVYTRDGRSLLFSSDRTGIYNIYAWEVATGKLWQVTNVLGGAFRPAPSPDGRLLAYQGFGADGYDIHLAGLEPARFIEALPPVSTRPDPPAIPEENVVQADRPYRALRSVWPRRYSLNYGPDSFGQALTITTDGSDAVGLHAWALGLTYGFARSTLNVSGSYWYGGLWPSLGVGAFRSISQRGGLWVDGANHAFIETDVGGEVDAAFPLMQTADRTVNLGLGYRLELLTNRDRHQVPHDPNQLIPLLPEEGRLASLAAGVGYSDAQSYLYSISPERGRYVHLGVSVMHPVLGSEYTVVQTDWQWSEYLGMPWLRRHVLALRYAGGLGMGTLTRRGIFWLGGYGSTPDVLRTYIDPRAPRMGGPALRGYTPYSLYGDQFHLLNVEYRFPIVYLERGAYTLPLWLSRAYGAVYVDCGNAFYGDLDPANLKLGVGGQVSLDSIVGYYLFNTLTLGFARGLMTRGVNQFYFFVGGSF
jgi:hypothetical protein